MTPTIGLRFFHARVLDVHGAPGPGPQLYQVTRIARGYVYYRPVYHAGTERVCLGLPDCCELEQFGGYVHSLPVRRV